MTARSAAAASTASGEGFGLSENFAADISDVCGAASGGGKTGGFAATGATGVMLAVGGTNARAGDSA